MSSTFRKQSPVISENHLGLPKRRWRFVAAWIITSALLASTVLQVTIQAAEQPSAIYVSSAKDFRVVPLIKGSLPNLNQGVDLVASAPCQTDLNTLPSVYPLSNGGFLTIWWNGETKKHCYSRFTPDGKGSFTEKFMGAWQGGGGPLLPTDLNGDQQDDLILIKRSSSEFHSTKYQVALGKSDGRFELIGTPVRFGMTKQWTEFPTIADADNDGHADFIYHIFSSGGNEPTNLYMLKGQGDGTFATNETLLLHSSHGAHTVVIADFNEDGYPDIFLPPDDDVADEGQSHIAFGTDNGQFGPVRESIDFVPDLVLSKEEWTADTFRAVAYAYDVNLDGHLDLVVSEIDITGNKITKKVYWGNGQGEFEKGCPNKCGTFVRDVWFGEELRSPDGTSDPSTLSSLN